MRARWMAGLVVLFSTVVLTAMSAAPRRGSAQPAAGVKAGEGNDMTPEEAKAAQEAAKKNAPAAPAAPAAARAPAAAAPQAGAAAPAPAQEQKEEKTGCCG